MLSCVGVGAPSDGCCGAYTGVRVRVLWMLVLLHMHEWCRPQPAMLAGCCEGAPAHAVLLLQGSIGTSRRRGTRTSSGTSRLDRSGCDTVGRAAAGGGAVDCKRADGNSSSSRHQAHCVLILSVPHILRRPVTRQAAPSSAAAWSSTPTQTRCPPAKWPSPWMSFPLGCVRVCCLSVHA